MLIEKECSWGIVDFNFIKEVKNHKYFDYVFDFRLYESINSEDGFVEIIMNNEIVYDVDFGDSYFGDSSELSLDEKVKFFIDFYLGPNDLWIKEGLDYVLS